jgi:cell division septation protein DedD
MDRRILGGLALGLAALALVLVVYHYYPGESPPVGPGQPEPSAELPYRTVPEFAEKPAPEVPQTPPPQKPPPAPLIKQAGPPPEALPKPEVSPPAAVEKDLPPLEPEEYYGLLVGKYRKYQDASKMMAKLKKQGKPAFIRRDARQRKPYQVWVGPFPSQQETKVAAKSLRAKFKISPKLEKLEIPVPK